LGAGETAGRAHVCLMVPTGGADPNPHA
jgi:hypothetical protein